MDSNNFNTDQNTSVINSAAPAQTNGMAIASLVLGIISIVAGCCVPIVGIILGIVGIVLSVLSKKSGKSKMGTAGLICSIVGIIFSILSYVLAAAMLAALAEAGFDMSAFGM